MITPNQLKRELNKQRRKNESKLIDIMFSLIDIEDVIQREEFPIEEIKERIQRIKENIGKELSDWYPTIINQAHIHLYGYILILIYT